MKTEPIDPPQVALSLPTVTVVICAYTEARWGDLVSAVASIHAQTWQAQQCVLVIDHNQTLFHRARAEFPWVEVVENSEHQGLAGARNVGIARSKGEIVAFLDDDASAAPDWLEQLGRP